MKVKRISKGIKIRYREDDLRTPIDPDWTAALIERYREGAPLRVLGAEFGVSHMTVSNIVNRWESWYNRHRHKEPFVAA